MALTSELAVFRGAASQTLWGLLWGEICSYQPDVVVLVARKMPRLFEALRLDVGEGTICVSDQAIPFIHKKLWQARVAIVDDLWNKGTTMLKARERVVEAGARSVRMFALGARDAAAAANAGVILAYSRSLSDESYDAFVNSVPRRLRLVAKPYDADFPIVRCMLQAPFSNWKQCWGWLQSQFGTAAHSTTMEEQLQSNFARAAVDLRTELGWIVKARLYFDFASCTCNLVPMALAPSLTLSNVYPENTLARKSYAALECVIREACESSEQQIRDGLGRASAFCDALMFLDEILASLAPLLQREMQQPFSFPDFSMQFGPRSTDVLLSSTTLEGDEIDGKVISDFMRARSALGPQPLLADERISGRATGHARCRMPVQLVLDALLQDLANVVGSEFPENYALDFPYTREQVATDPYLRLRIGFSYSELVQFFRSNLPKTGTPNSATAESVVSELIDQFVDMGAIVPTIALHSDPCVRIYRKGESNPQWDEEVKRVDLALRSLPPAKQRHLIKEDRARVTKIAAILSISGFSTLQPGAAERGTVAMLGGRSVVEREDVELTLLLHRLGYWQRMTEDQPA